MHKLWMLLFGVLMALPAMATESFEIRAPSSWKLSLKNESGAVYSLQNSKNKETVILRTFAASTSMQKRISAYRDDLPGLLKARNRTLEALVGGNFWVDEVKSLKRKPGAKYDSLQIDGRFVSESTDRRVIERQYFIGNQIFQITFTSKSLSALAPGEVEKYFEYFKPKAPSRLPASQSEIVGGRFSVAPSSARQSTEIPELIARPQSAFERECYNVPVEKRRKPSGETPADYQTLFGPNALHAGCAVGLKDLVFEFVDGTIDMGVGIWKYSTDSEYYEQTNAAVAMVWNEASSDFTAFGKKIVTNTYNTLAQSASESWNCLSPRAQAELVCKMLPGIISSGLGARMLVGKLTASEVKSLAATADKAIGETAGDAAKLAAAAKKPDIKIPETHRPTKEISDSGRAREKNEIVSGGHMPKTKAEMQAYLNSPDFRDGTYVMMVVRDAKGVDHLMFDNRIPEGSEALSGKINTHRTLRQKYRDENGGNDPKVVAAGECIVSMVGTLVGCINRAGTYFENNDSLDYLVDSAKAAGFKDDGHMKRVQFKLGESEEAGHVNANVAVLHEQEVLKNHPGLLPAARQYARTLYTRHPGDNSSGIDLSWARKANSLGRKGNPAFSEEKNRAYSLIYQLTLSMREGTNTATRGVMGLMKDQAKEAALVEKYLPQFIDDVDALP